MGRPAFTEHPEFLNIASIASDVVVQAATRLGISNEIHSIALERRVNRVVDDLTKLLIRAADLHDATPAA